MQQRTWKLGQAAGWLVLALTAVGCASIWGVEEQTYEGSRRGGGGGQGTTTSAGSGGIGGGIGGSNAGCSGPAPPIYILSDTSDLYRFEPLNKAFTKIGPLTCPTSMKPNSMAVDRNGVAWVNYVESGALADSAGVIFKVSTNDASCEAAPSVKLPYNWYRVGMGFATNQQGGVDETLFVAPAKLENSAGLGRIDAATKTVVSIGSFTGGLAGQSCDLAGNGDAQLYGLFPTEPVEFAEIDKSSGSILWSNKLPQIPIPSAWAFSFWGGEFYLFTSVADSSNVTRYRPSDGAIDASYVTDVGFKIVGASASTCAPIERL